MGDAGFEPGTSAPEVWCAINEPPHLLIYTLIYSTIQYTVAQENPAAPIYFREDTV